MPRKISLDGLAHSFPDDATDQEIAAALEAINQAESEILSPRASQRDVRQLDNAIEEKAAYSKMLGERRLGAKDKSLYMGFFVPTHEQLKMDRDELTLSNLDELEKEIKRTKDPKAKQILVEEHGRMKTSFANILGIK